MRNLKTRAQFQAMLATAPVARTSHFVLYHLPVTTAAAFAKPRASQTPKEAPVDAKLPVADFAEAAQAFSRMQTHCGHRACTEHLWLGALVPKRWSKRAVTRNLIRRQIAAIAATALEMKASLPCGGLFVPQAYLVRLRAGFHNTDNRRNAARSKRHSAGAPAVQPAAVFRSAASDALKTQVRQELLALFAQAERAAPPRAAIVHAPALPALPAAPGSL